MEKYKKRHTRISDSAGRCRWRTLPIFALLRIQPFSEFFWKIRRDWGR
jgi:hypothetical protein